MEPNFQFFFRNEVKPLASISLDEIASFECPSDYVVPLEDTGAYALFLVSKGRGTYTVSEAEYHVKEGDMFALYPGTEITCRSDAEDPWSLITVSFDGVDARLLLNAAGFQPKAPVRHLEKIAAEHIVQILAAISKFTDQSIFGTIQNTAFLYTLMASLAKSAQWVQADIPPGWTGVIHFQKAVKYITEYYHRPITVNDIASHVGLSYNRLYRIFMEQNFMAPQQYLTEVRIHEGRRLLERRAGSIKEISHAVGIDDPLYFSKLFKQTMGQSPANYMKAIAKKSKDAGEKKS